MCFIIRHGKKLWRPLRVSVALRSWPASRKLQCLVSVSSRRHGSQVSSRSRLRRSRAHPCYSYSCRSKGITQGV